MENASKALLIAAAILIAIILISLGLLVINQGRTAIDEAGAGVSEVAIQTFNAKFEPYFGKTVNGTKVRSLIDAINSNNNANIDEPAKTIYVRIRYVRNERENGITTKSPDRTVIDVGKNYEVRACIELDSLKEKDPLWSVTNGSGYANGYIHWIIIMPSL